MHPYGCIITKERDRTTPMVVYDPMAYVLHTAMAYDSDMITTKKEKAVD